MREQCTAFDEALSIKRAWAQRSWRCPKHYQRTVLLELSIGEGVDRPFDEKQATLSSKLVS